MTSLHLVLLDIPSMLEGLMIENEKSNGQWLVFQKYTEIQLSIYMQYEKDVKFSWANFETKV